MASLFPLSNFKSCQVYGQPDTEILISPEILQVGIYENETITMNITNVSDLFLWQVALKYNGTLVKCTGAWLPDDNVFAGKPNQPGEPVFGIDYVDGMAYVLYGVTLFGSDSVNVASGILCKLNFTGILHGQTPLLIATKENPIRFNPPPSVAFYSSLFNWDLAEMPFVEHNGIIRVGAALIGDLNMDERVDMRDISIVAAAFGSSPGHERWNLSADLNQDGKIDLKDVGTVAKHFGDHYS
jgi:hypothetical protein